MSATEPFCNVTTIPLDCSEEQDMAGTVEWAREFNCTATFAGMSLNGHRMYTFDGEWPGRQ